MSKSLLIAVREWKERVLSRSFIIFSLVGPMIVLGLIYLLFTLGGKPKQHWNVLIADPAGILSNKIVSSDDKSVTYSFADGYIDDQEFSNAKKYQQFDALLEVNEKVFSNKIGHTFYREKPSVRMQTLIHYHFERRLEEKMIEQFTDMSLQKFREIKQPITLEFHDVYDPHNKASDLSVWVGLFFGTVIFVFIFLFGMTILRSINREKSNRIVEVLLASVSPKQLLAGKIIGVGLSALIQFLVWALIIGGGLYFMRENLFPDLLDASKMNVKELSLAASNVSYQEQYFAAREYNRFVQLIYEQVKFGNVLGFFIVFFLAGYLFYGALFASIGATMGSESDGQQFVLPLIFLLCFALYSGYYTMNYPEGPMANLFHYLPFTSPVVVMVKLMHGYAPGHAHEIYLSLLTLLISGFITLAIAGRLYRNGILQFGHRLRIRHLLTWLKKS